MMKKRVGSFTQALAMALPLAACGQNTAAADYIAAQMESIGLEVEKVPVTVDKWQFNDASLTMKGTDISIIPAAYTRQQQLLAETAAAETEAMQALAEQLAA